MTKPELRKYYASRRMELSAAEVANQSAAIAKHLFEVFQIEKMQSIHCFLPIRKKHEVDTFHVIYTIQEHLPQVSIVVPRVIPNTNDLENYLWYSDITLDINEWGVLEPNPISNIKCTNQTFQLVIVPLLAYDKQGNRVGYGKGFYDTFLAQCKPSTLKVGVSFFEPAETIDDVGNNDVKLDYCITPYKVWKF